MDARPHPRRRVLVGGALLALGAAGLSRDGARPPIMPLDVRDFGATGDGATLDTTAIQAALDTAAARGGTVVIPAGVFLSGTLTLRSGVTLHLCPGAVLRGSPRVEDYPAHPFPARDLDVGGHLVWALLYAEDAERIAVEGEGEIDGQGAHFPRVEVRDPEVPTRPRPRMIFFRNCRDVRLQDVTLREPGIWTVHLALCDAVSVRGLRVTSSVGLNQDGIVLDSCRGATISDCHVDTVDDAVVLKSSFPRPCSDVAVRGCVLRSRCAGLKLGTQSLGGFRAVTVSDCVLHDCRLGGLKFQTVDGGDLEDVTVRDITMIDVAAPLSFRRGRRAFDYGFTDVELPRPVGRLRGVRIRGVRATVTTAGRDGHTMSVAGIPGFPVEDVTVEDAAITFPGGGTPQEARRVGIPERESAYPEHTMFGVLPAYGLWMRHAARVTLDGVRFELAAPEARPALVADDVTDLALPGFTAAGAGPTP